MVIYEEGIPPDIKGPEHQTICRSKVNGGMHVTARARKSINQSYYPIKGASHTKRQARQCPQCLHAGAGPKADPTGSSFQARTARAGRIFVCNTAGNRITDGRRGISFVCMNYIALYCSTIHEYLHTYMPACLPARLPA
ncbi:hypothetical protein I7I50_00719 [Histoplasma capsulatum G186AR]|uniref:Uncharacterized protein n=1 Tax=Ajellomyces capsulatus TaxID=5037 RepID=A0A8H7YED8_AJECA|nr:hypothetical protein I7I52_07987 [Histoplasma capsulatum]QSS72772.1 hypothetical protein I7I50_00719 [Histoplasma capsulatum G186AR]